MFSSISRYRRLPDVVTADALGRAVSSKSLRPLPEVSGRFLHTVQDGDRIDQLAFKYHNQPRDWWRIMDANPSFMSPDELLGTDPVVTIQVPVTWDGPEPPWSVLLHRVRDIRGVQAARFGLPEFAHARVDVLQGSVAFDIPAALTAELDSSTRTQTITPPLAAALLAEAVSFSSDVRLARLDAVTWRIGDNESRRVYTFEHLPDQALLNVDESAFRYDWVLVVAHNRVVLSAAGILAAVESEGFAAGAPAEVRRLGRPIVIPPRRA
jgi:hypothetical protein